MARREQNNKHNPTKFFSKASAQRAAAQVAAPQLESVPPVAAGAPAQPEAAAKTGGGKSSRKSRFAHVHWASKAKVGNRAWTGKITATSTHPYLATPLYHTQEEAARAVDR